MIARFMASEHVDAAVRAYWASFKITGQAVFYGMVADAAAAGQLDSFPHFMAYLHAHLWAWVVANLIAPTARARYAYVQSQRAANGKP